MAGTRLDCVEVKGIKFEVVYRNYPGYHGARDSIGGIPGAGPPLEPDESPSVEIESVKVISGTDTVEVDLIDVLSQDTIDKIEQILLEGTE